MPKFQVMIADEAGHKLYDETIEAPGPKEACLKAAADAETANVAEAEEEDDPVMLLRRLPKADRG